MDVLSQTIEMYVLRYMGLFFNFIAAKDKGKLDKITRVKKTTLKTTRPNLNTYSRFRPYTLMFLGGVAQGQYVKADGTKGFCGSKGLKESQSEA